MDTIFINSENSKTSDAHRLLLNLSDKINLKGSDKYVALSSFSIYCTCKNIKMLYKNNKFKISPTTWNRKFKLPDESYSVSDTQHYFECIIKKHQTMTDNPSIKVYVNKLEKRITFKIKARYCFELLMPETIKLLGRINNKTIKN